MCVLALKSIHRINSNVPLENINERVIRLSIAKFTTLNLILRIVYCKLKHGGGRKILLALVTHIATVADIAIIISINFMKP